jgi:hypothetical protein
MTGRVLSVQQYPLLWINGNYYNNYKDNEYYVSGLEGDYINTGDSSDYAKITTVNLFNQLLTTDFTEEMLGKFVNLVNLYLNDNQITDLNLTSVATSLKSLNIVNNLFTLPAFETILGQLDGKMTNGLIQGNFLPNYLRFVNTDPAVNSYHITLQNTTGTEMSILSNFGARGCLIFSKSGNRFGFVFTPSGSLNVPTLNVTMPINQWAFYEIERVGTTVNIRMNGALASTASGASTSNLVFNTIGGIGFTTNTPALKGWIHSLVIQNNGVTIHNYLLNEGTGLNVTDTVGNNNGTVNPNITWERILLPSTKTKIANLTAAGNNVVLPNVTTY